MKEYEARELGFEYTGMGASVYDTTGWEKDKARAQEIKRTYKGADFRVVSKSCATRYGSEGWKNIYGNKIFRQAQYFNPEVEEKYLNEGHNKRLEELKKKYEEEVQKEMEYYQQRKDKYDYLMSIKK